jgi:2-methylcitrate dehydratase PrpD
VEVEAVRTDGQRATVRIARAPGHPSRALTWDDLAAKFMDCATQARINPGKAERAFGILKRLETCVDVREVLILLHGNASCAIR